jgi:poly-gamma-glutamate capsule biosynthesis protein CapA/YwtB (metallophosphatase superfamily)
MEFLSIREFSASPRKTQQKLKEKGKLVLTNNGKPTMLVLDITGRDIEDVIDTQRRIEALQLLDNIQTQAVRGGLNTMSLREINAEINDYRKTTRKAKRRQSN